MKQDVTSWAAPARRRARRGPHPASAWGLSALLLGLASCAGEPASCAVEGCETAGEVRVATWWARRGEYAPFDILKQGMRRSTRLETRLAHTLQTKGEHLAWIEEQLDPATESPKPVDVFSANNGDEILRWTPCAASGPPENGPRLRAVNDPALGRTFLTDEWLDASFRPEVIDTLRCPIDGGVYALPVGIHRINTLFYNKALFRAAGYALDDPRGRPFPRTLDELHAAAARLAEHLPPADPRSNLPPSVFAVAGREAWTLSLFFIENVMLSAAEDAGRYEAFWSGRECNEPLLESALSHVARLRPHFGSWELSANDALGRVASGQAAMVVMGDWARAEVDPDVVGSLPFPGTERSFVFTADVFALPSLPTSDAHVGLAWLRAVTGERTQREFSAAKNALPARAAMSPERDDLAWVRSLPAYLPARPEGPFASLQDVLKDWLDSGDETAEALLTYTRQEYPKLSGDVVACPGGAPVFDPPLDAGAPYDPPR